MYNNYINNIFLFGKASAYLKNINYIYTYIYIHIYANDLYPFLFLVFITVCVIAVY